MLQFVKRYGVYIISGVATTVAFIFGIQGGPVKIEVAGTPVPIAEFVATHGGLPARPSPNSRDVAYVYSGQNTGMIYEIRPAGSKWYPHRKGQTAPWTPATNQKFRVVTMQLTDNEISRLEGTFRAWNRINDVDNPTSILPQSFTVTPTFTPTP